MIIPTSRLDSVLGVHSNKVYQTSAISAAERVSKGDEVTISRFSALVEHGMAYAIGLPEVRADRVAQVREALANGTLPGSADIAGSMINSAVEGQV